MGREGRGGLCGKERKKRSLISAQQAEEKNAILIAVVEEERGPFLMATGKIHGGVRATPAGMFVL